jgi:peptidyl-prolyl cis-trans isomerase B (cyclophilin B)
MSLKRDKELARAKWERQQARRTAKAHRDSLVKRSVLAGLVVVGIAAYAIANQAPGTPSAKPTNSSAPSQSTKSDPATAAGCKEVDRVKSAAAQVPTATLPGVGAKTLELDTNCGAITIAMDPKAPTTTNVMTNLAKAHYFDRTACHRLTTSGIYVLQCGDPTGTGSGTPGFEFADENLPETNGDSTYDYNRGTIAMANSGPGTNGSQFFIVYDKSPLPPNYSIWGQVTSGLAVIDRIAAAGVEGGGTDGKPNANVVITRALAQ